MKPETVVSRVVGVPEDAVHDGTSNEELSEWDSLAHVNLVLELEQVYGVSISTAQAVKMKDVATIKDVLRSAGAEW